MNVHDYATRRDARLARAAAVVCRCGHRADEHRERGYGNPGHEAGRFYCRACKCARYEAQA